jgi:hypothetical protein
MRRNPTLFSMVALSASWHGGTSAYVVPLYQLAFRTRSKECCINQRPIVHFGPRPSRYPTTCLSISASSGNGEQTVAASAIDDLEALQSLFSKLCDSDGLMNAGSIKAIDEISELLVS